MMVISNLNLTVWKVCCIFYAVIQILVSLLHIFLIMLHSVLESDPEFGFEEAKQQLEGIYFVFLSHFSTIFTFSTFVFELFETLISIRAA